MNLNEWTDLLADTLGVEHEVEIDAILDLARDAAHGIDRPAAPLTTFILGLAVAERGGSAADFTECYDLAEALIAAHQ